MTTKQTPDPEADLAAEQRLALVAEALRAAHHAIDVLAESFEARGVPITKPPTEPKA